MLGEHPYPPLAFLVRCTPDVAAHTEHHNLPESDRFRVCHTKRADPGEVRAQNAGTVAELLEGNNEDQNAVLDQPVMRVFKEQPLQAPIAGQIDLRIIRRVQIEHGKALDLRVGVEDIALDHPNPGLCGFLRAPGIEFHPKPKRWRTSRDQVERRSFPRAGIDHRTGP